VCERVESNDLCLGFVTVFNLSSFKFFHATNDISRFKALYLLVLIYLVFEKTAERNVFLQPSRDKASCGSSALEITNYHL
jgi:hypothetical protein